MDRPSDGMTLEELREEYDWMYEFQSRMAERITSDKDVHNLVDYVNRLEAENARLRSEFESIGTVAYLYGRGDLKAENAKLRELVADMWSEGMCECGSLGKCERCIYDYPIRMRELGVEV